MAIELYWDDDAQTVLLAEFEERWTWDELYALFEKIGKVVRQKDCDLFAIVDLRRGFNLPTPLLDPRTLEEARKIFSMPTGELGPMVVVGASPLIRTVYEQVRALDRDGNIRHLHFTRTMKAGRRWLDTYRNGSANESHDIV